ncbi:MAG TPA: 5-oxoprolinase subunit PxpA [Actinotalea sp.]|jgi:UPF0271 protein
MRGLVVDLNSDVGESFGSWQLGDDAAMMQVVSSANIACGFHAGDALTARRTCDLAAANGVRVGAHVGYRDLAGFGRRFVDVAPDELTAEVVYQIGALRAVATTSGTSVSYVKPHGALYNTIAHDAVQAAAVVRALVELDAGLPILVPPGSVVERLASQAGLRAVREAFADRAYAADGSLVDRVVVGAVLHDPGAVAERAVRMVTEGVVAAADGSLVRLDALSICVHGDTPGAFGIARAVRSALDAAGVEVASFV